MMGEGEKKRNIIHRDLKPDNILIKTYDNGKIVVCKIADFGTSKKLEDVHGTYVKTNKHIKTFI